MNPMQRKAINKLIDESERTYLALLDNGQDHQHLNRAIKEAKRVMAIDAKGAAIINISTPEPETRIIVAPLECPFLSAHSLSIYYTLY